MVTVMGELGVTVSMSERGYYDCICYRRPCPKFICSGNIFGIDGLPLIIVGGSWSLRCLNYKYNHYHVRHWYRGSMSQFLVQMPHNLTSTGYYCF